MVDADLAVRLVRRYLVTGPNERLDITVLSDAVAVRSRWMDLLVREPRQPYTIQREPWVARVVEASRDDLLTRGRTPVDAFLITREGDIHHLNDAADVAVLARRLRDGMAPKALAEILVWFHPWTSAAVGLVESASTLREQFPEVANLPTVDEPRVTVAGDDLLLAFYSWVRYTHVLGGDFFLRVARWTVTVPPAGPAIWQSVDIASDIPLPRGGGRG